jgi:mutator protein MutT
MNTEIEKWDVYDNHGNKIKNKYSERGSFNLLKDEYHLVVYIWIINSNKETIITKRQKGKSFEGSWECTGGCVKSGESSKEAAVREVREELGLFIPIKKMKLFKRYIREFPKGANAICDIWLVNYDFNINDIIIQIDEVSDYKIIKLNDINKYINLTDKNRYPYLYDLIRYNSMK